MDGNRTETTRPLLASDEIAGIKCPGHDLMMPDVFRERDKITSRADAAKEAMKQRALVGASL
tara:strand:+ start:2741 stop:2926 length:186 start_codon:yes stop_codon:yes gene_type:complete